MAGTSRKHWGRLAPRRQRPCVSSHVTEPSLAFGRTAAGVDWGAEDGPAHLIFLIAAPSGGGSDHMTILAAPARRLVHASSREALTEVADPSAAADLITREVGGA